MDIVDDSVVFIEKEAQDVLLLNSSAKFIFEGLLEQLDVNQIVENYMKSNSSEIQDTSYDIIFNDFSSTVETLFEKGVVFNV